MVFFRSFSVPEEKKETFNNVKRERERKDEEPNKCEEKEGQKDESEEREGFSLLLLFLRHHPSDLPCVWGNGQFLLVSLFYFCSSKRVRKKEREERENGRRREEENEMSVSQGLKGGATKQVFLKNFREFFLRKIER